MRHSATMSSFTSQHSLSLTRAERSSMAAVYDMGGLSGSYSVTEQQTQKRRSKKVNGRGVKKKTEVFVCVF